MLTYFPHGPLGPKPALLVGLSGCTQLAYGNYKTSAFDGAVYLPAHSELEMLFSKGSEWALVQGAEHNAAPGGWQSLNNGITGIADGIRHLIETYLQHSRHFISHSHACVRTTKAVSEIAVLINHRLAAGREEAYKNTCPLMDARIERVMHFIRDSSEWKYSLTDLTDIACMSERNLYKRMKESVGLAPYQYYQRSQLLRFRDDLNRTNDFQQTISWYGMSHGFKHLGRLPKMYRHHFGEKPSDTLKWRQEILQRTTPLMV